MRLGRVRLGRVRLGKTKRERHRLAAGKRLGRGGVHSHHGTAHAAARLSLIAEIPAALEGLRAITERHAGGLKAGFAVGYGLLLASCSEIAKVWEAQASGRSATVPLASK